MVRKEYLIGELDVAFKCGCSGEITYQYEYDIITGEKESVELDLVVKCNRHSELLTIEGDVVWNILDDIVRKLGLANGTYKGLIRNYSSYKLDVPLDYFFYIRHWQWLQR